MSTSTAPHTGGPAAAGGEETLAALPDDPALAGGRSRWRPVAVVLLVLGLAVGWLVVGRVAGPGDGSLVLPSATAWRHGVVVVDVVPGSPLHKGDRVLAVDNVPLERWASTQPPARSNGDAVVYEVVRDGRQLTVTGRLTGYPLGAVTRHDAPLLLVLLVMALVGALVFLARPRDAAARVMMVVGALLLSTSTSYPAGLQVVDLARRHGDWGYVGGDLAAALFWGALLHFSYVFPEPVLDRRRLRLLVPLLYLVPFLLYAGDLALRLPTTHDPLTRWALLHDISSPAARVVPFLAALRVAMTWRSTRDPDVRRRIGWVVVAFLVGFGVYLGLGQLPDLVSGSPLVPWEWLVLGLAPIPVAIAAAVLRYRLFDIEVILTRSLLYGTLTVLAVVIYSACYYLFVLLPEGGTPAFAFIAGVVTAVGLHPLRVRVAAAATRLVYGERDDPYEVLARLDRLPTGTALAEVLEAVAETLAATLRLPYVAIDIDGGFHALAGTAEAVPEEPLQVPIRHGDRPLGRLALGVGPRRERFGPADRRLLETVARRIGEAVNAGLLHADLQWSRQRIVLAREEERRRLRRDLHDGIGPSLAGLGMQLEVIRDDVLVRPERARERIDHVVSGTQDLVLEIRRVVDGLRPAALDQLGLEGALHERLRWLAADDRELAVDLDVESTLGQLPAAVEVAAYNIANEAATNAVRHSGARRCTVTVRRDLAQRELVVEVADDGRGLATDVRHGVGLLSMRDRAEELGGSCSVSPRPGGGTVVHARLPVPSSKGAP